LKPESSISDSGLDALDALDCHDGDDSSEPRHISRDISISLSLLPLLAAAPL